MLRRTMMTLFAVASLGMFAPDLASARGFGGGGHMGGFGGGHMGGHMGGFGGGHMGGHMGGFGGGHMGGFGGGFGARPMGGGFSHAAMIGGGGFGRGAMIGGGGRFAHGFSGGGFRHGFHHGRRFPFGAFAAGVGLGLYAPYGYYGDDYYGDYGYGGYGYGYPYYAASYYGDDGGCYIVRRRVATPYGLRIRRVTVCD
jgi:hypothetical protein